MHYLQPLSSQIGQLFPASFKPWADDSGWAEVPEVEVGTGAACPAAPSPVPARDTPSPASAEPGDLQGRALDG